MTAPQPWRLEDLVDPARPITYGIVLPGPDIEGGTPYIRVVDMHDGTVATRGLRRTTSDIAMKYRRSEVQPGDVLLSIRGHVGRVAVVPEGLEGANLTQDTARIAVRDYDPHYIAWALRSPAIQRWMVQRTKGVAVQGINLSDVKEIPLTVPAPAQQRRIAALLGQADGIRRKRRESLTLLDDLLRATFIDMFGDPVANPHQYPTSPLDEVIEAVESGWSANGLDRPAQDEEWGVLKISAVTSGYFRPAENKAVEAPNFAKPPVVPRRGDLLFSRANTRDLVAATCLVQEDWPRLFLPDKLWRLRCRTDTANITWLRFLLANPSYRSTVTARATGTSGSMLNISQEKLLGMSAPVPPLPSQLRFHEFVWHTLDQRDRYVVSARELDSLFNGLLHTSFP